MYKCILFISPYQLIFFLSSIIYLHSINTYANKTCIIFWILPNMENFILEFWFVFPILCKKFNLMLLIFKSHVGMTSASCRDEMLSLSPFLNLYNGFPCDSAGKESTCNVGDLGSIPGLGRSPGEVKGCPFQYSSLDNSMDSIAQGVAKSLTRLSDFLFHFPSIQFTTSKTSITQQFSLTNPSRF